MCCFSPVTLPATLLDRVLGRRPRTGAVHVSGTRIFARMTGDGRQALAYQMKLTTPAPVAMVLPLPIHSVGEGALEFVDLSGYPSLFDDLERAFPAPILPQAKGFGPLRMQSRQKLAVVKVGEFVASFVPTVKDFDRLDERFRLPDRVWDALPRYRDAGFAVFQLGREGGGERKVHPMAFTFRTREPGALFFPTVHVHDGAVHPEASFDHVLYGQGATFGERSELSAELVVKLDLAKGLVGQGSLRRLVLHGLLPNDDQRMELSAA